MLLAVFLLAFLALKTCASHGDEIDYEEAEAIARDRSTSSPRRSSSAASSVGSTRILYWAVSLSTTNAAGIREDCATVLVDSETGATETEPC